MANPQQAPFVLPTSYALKAELIGKDDDVAQSRLSVQRILEQETVGQWARLALEEFGNNWLLRIALRVKEVRDGGKKFCVVACGGGNDILVLINTAKMPKDVRTIPKIGVDVCLGSNKGGAVLDREDPMNNYGILCSNDTLRDHINSEFATGATDVRLFFDTNNNTFIDVTEGSIRDKRVVRFTVLKNSTDWRLKSVDRESADPAIFHLLGESHAVAAAAAAPPPAHHQDEKSSDREEEAKPPAKIAKKSEESDKEPSEKAKASNASEKKKKARNKKTGSTAATGKSSDADESSDKKPAAAPKKRKGADDKDSQPAGAVEKGKAAKKSRVDKSAGEEGAAKRKPALCYWFPYCKKHASECGGHSRTGCSEVREGRVVVPDGLSDDQLKKEKRKAKKKLEQESKEKRDEPSGRDAAEDVDTAGEDASNEETSKRSEENDREPSEKAKASNAPEKKKKARDKKTDSTAAAGKSSETDEPDKKPAASKKRKEADDKDSQPGAVEKGKAAAKKSRVDKSAGEEGAAKRKPAFCYWFPYCKKNASECGGHSRTGCSEVREGRVVVPEGLSDDQLKKEKRKAKKKLEKESKEKADEPSGQDTAENDEEKRKAEKKPEKESKEKADEAKGRDTTENDDTSNAAGEGGTNGEEEDTSPDVSSVSDDDLAKFAKSSDRLCYYFPFCKKFAKDCGGIRGGTCNEVSEGRVTIPAKDKFETLKKKTKSKLKKLRKQAHEAEKEKTRDEAAKNTADEGDGSDDSTVTEQKTPKRKDSGSSKPSPKPTEKSKEKDSPARSSRRISDKGKTAGKGKTSSKGKSERGGKSKGT